jgi:hypothetical protein
VLALMRTVETELKMQQELLQIGGMVDMLYQASVSKA